MKGKRALVISDMVALPGDEPGGSSFVSGLG